MGWIPVTKEMPKQLEKMHVTYLGYWDKQPYCNDIAYRVGNEWYWGHNGEKVEVVITAWKPLGEPYKGE